jgi:outer membrane biogenesis lipoprotein LolB
MMRLALTVCAVALLAGCAEPDQGETGVRSDTAVWQGTGVKPFVAGGWNPGDKNSWEQHLKVRTQQGQNDYAKVN